MSYGFYMPPVYEKKNYAHIIRRRIAPIAVYYLDTRSFRATPPPLYTKKIPCSRVNKR